MNKIIYYVATSLDGFISGGNEDVSSFLPDGNGVQKYLDDLKEFETVIMGRKTYEFGYKFGLQPGALAYPHMDHYIFSKNLSFENADKKLKVEKLDLNTISKIRNASKSDIYLCGGGDFAGWMLENEQIDILKLKVNPLILGKGVRLFGNSKKEHQLALLDTAKYNGGLLINTYEMKY
jgi:dihydrofolate reductase